MASIFQIYNLKKKTEELLGKEIADTFITDEALSGLEVTNQEKANRMNMILVKMEKGLGENTVIQIRKKTSCNITNKQKEIIKKAKKEFKTLIDQINMINDGIKPTKIKMNNNEIQFEFNQGKCICGMFKKIIDAKSTKTYCYCCAGNVEKIMSYVLDKDVIAEPVKVFLLEDDNCTFLVREKKTEEI